MMQEAMASLRGRKAEELVRAGSRKVVPLAWVTSEGLRRDEERERRCARSRGVRKSSMWIIRGS